MIIIMNHTAVFAPPGRASNIFSISISPCRPRNDRANTWASIRMNIMMAVILLVSSAASRKVFRLNRPDTAVMITAPTAPMEAASVGAAMPPTIDPSTATTSMMGGTKTLKKRSHRSRRDSASRSAIGTGGMVWGLSMPITSR